MSRFNFDHLVLIGMNFVPVRETGDKNFWVELLPHIAEGLKRISIYSIREHDQDTETINLNGASVTIKYLPPKFLETPGVKCKQTKIFWKEGAFPAFYGVIEKFLNIKRLQAELKQLYTQQAFSQIHLMDNLGVANKVLASLQLAPVSVSAMSYQGRNSWMYDYYVKLSYSHKNLTVTPYSATYAKKLVQLGIKKDQVAHIPWGVPTSSTSYNKETIKKTLALPNNKPLILWAGYTQQIQKKDFYFALKVAKAALNKGLDATFFFAFKPECYEKEFLDITPNKAIIIKPTQVDEFQQLRRCTNIFFAPVLNNNCILAPPLTWIELLSGGVPIITTSVPGASEIVINGETGYIGDDEEDLLNKIFLLVKNHSTMSLYCKKKVKESYNIQTSAQRFLDLWEGKI